ncbi:MAG: hypothetical protein [Bacteriophage sp.]|nr:MAG: hypothetical protein [Bacteriophage sp.]
MNNIVIADPLYTKTRVCEYFGIDDTTLDKWVARAKFPKPDLYLGRSPRWKLSTLVNFSDAKQQEHAEQQLCG